MWLGISLLLIAAIVSIAFLTGSGEPAHPGSRLRKLSVSMDARGRAEIAGIPMGNTNVRDAAFKAMDKLAVEPRIVVPKTMTNGQQASNFIQVLESVNRAGLSREKAPNPYE